ncbi:MAG TPA: RIP metalloprotease RseP [Saprospiraceae bacterium]|nr:RIP metalloprotease RseP [Saprospiraceae bacterium]
METFIKISQFLLSLSFLIILHEMGHFAPAKWFKTRVEKFYLFFDAWGAKLFSRQKGETEYGIGWLPLGGYVKIAGMVDESMDTAALKAPPQPWEFRSKPAWQRLIIMIGGGTVNFILGFLIFAYILWHYGEVYVPNSELKYGVAVDSVLLRQGLRQGDMILSVGNTRFDRLDEAGFLKAIALDNQHNVKVLRDGQEQTIILPDDIAAQITSAGIQKKLLIMARIPFYAEKLKKGDPADKAGIQVGDRIVAFNGQPTEFFDQFGPLARAHKGQPAVVTVERNGERKDISLTVSPQGSIGVFPKAVSKILNVSRDRYTLAEALPAGVQRGMDFLSDQVKAFGQMFRGKISAKDNLGSLISIGNMFPPYWDWEIFWNITASLSIVLAFMNLLPIPALDGGYVMFLIWEVVTGRRVSDAFMEKAVTIGFFLLIGLMLFAFGLDLMRFVF